MSGIIGKNASRSSGVIGTSDAGIASLAADSSPQLGGFLDAAGNYIQMEKGGDIASASPTVIDTDGDFFAVTGTTNFSAFTVAADRHFFLEFGGALTMTHGNGTLDLPGGANITTAASDVGEFVSTAANVVTCVNYTKRDGTAIVAGAGGDLRNFIIDGDFTQWPEGNITAASNGDYGPALFDIGFSVGTLVVNLTEETSVLPTVGQSGHQSGSCVKIDVTTAEAAFTGTEYASFRYMLTGTDYQHLHGQECTLVFWIRSGITGQSSVSFSNAAGNRQYIVPYTISSADTWEKKTITLTMDTSGTWTFTEADRGLMIRWNIGTGPDRNTGTNNQWNGDSLFSAASDVNLASDATKDIYISQVGLYLGSSAPTFTSPSVTTVARQVEYYVERYSLDSASNEHLVNINGTQTSTADSEYRWAVRKRVAPTVTFTAGATFAATTVSAGATCTAITASTIVPTGFRLRVTQAGTTWTIGGGGNVRRDGSDTANVLFDARH